MKITYDRAVVGDALKISVLLKTVYIGAYATEGVTTEFANFITNRFSKEHIEQKILDNADHFSVAKIEDNPIGVMELMFEGKCPIRKVAMPELSKLYVLERFASEGVGARLLVEAENILDQNGFKELWLEVWAENPRAIEFYQKNNFQTIGGVDFPMEKNTYLNYVMTKAIKIDQ